MDSIRVIYHHEGEGWWAESPDIPGWTAVAKTYAEILKLSEEGVPFALEREVPIEHFVPADARDHLAA